MRRRLLRRVVISLAALASASLAALQLPELDADRLVQEGRLDEARVAFDAWLSENGDSEQLFSVLLRRLALDPDAQSVQRALDHHSSSLSVSQVATIQMLPIDFAELSGGHERAFDLLSTVVAPGGPARAAQLASELDLEGDAPAGGIGAEVGRPVGAAAAYQRALDAWLTGDQSEARDELVALAAQYPDSPERHLADRQLASLAFPMSEPPAAADEPRPTVVPFPAPMVLLGLAYPALQHLAADPTGGDPTTRGEPTTNASLATTYTIQTGAYRDPVNADHVADQLRHAGFSAQVEASPAVEGSNVHRVLVGANLERAVAEGVLAELRAAGYDGFLRVATGA